MTPKIRNLDLRPYDKRVVDCGPGMKMGELIGFRAWYPIDGRLRSVSQGGCWTPGVNTANYPPITYQEYLDADIQGLKFVRSSVCSGFYAFKREDEEELNYPFYVVGSVYLWGTIVEHEKGYRAEFAQIRSLDRFPKSMSWQDRKNLIQRYVHDN